MSMNSKFSIRFTNLGGGSRNQFCEGTTDMTGPGVVEVSIPDTGNMGTFASRDAEGGYKALQGR